ncbi:MAG: ATP-binding protein [Aquabacterium sp.]
MPALAIAPLTPWITAAALQHGHALPDHLMQRLGISRRRANRLLQRLVDAQWLKVAGSPRRRHHQPGELRQVVRSYLLAGLQEDLPWRRDFAPFFDLPATVSAMAQHAFTELLNNAIDHSGGQQVTVSMRQTPLQLQLLVSDDGCGLFDRIAGSFDIDDATLAMLELGKGKLSSAPDRHSGHGLYFTSRLADVFDIHANAQAFQSRAWERRTWRAGRGGSIAARAGTSIYMAIALDTPRTLEAVRQAYSTSGTGCDFSRTEVPLVLLSGSAGALVSRAEARRAARRLGQFRRADLDFTGVAAVGHGFADELFRVFARECPDVELRPIGMSAAVAAMVQDVRQAA